MKKILWLAVLISLMFPFANGYSQEMPAADQERRSLSIMRPDLDGLSTWMREYEEAPAVSIHEGIAERLRTYQAMGYGTSTNLLGYIPYVPDERDQGYCGNCWVWAGSGIMEIAYSIATAYEDRLSIQFVNSCRNGAACCGGTLGMLTHWYKEKGYAIPWSNANAFYQDGDNSCGYEKSFELCKEISKGSKYPITSITTAKIPTVDLPSHTAVSNIKNVLHQNRGVWFAFFLPNQDAWDQFRSFWTYGGEDDLWNPDSFCGDSYNLQSGGGHAVLVVGYNDDDPDPSSHHWIVLNSWGTANNWRPNGLFRIPMSFSYSCSYSWPYGRLPAFQFQTLDVSFAKMLILAPNGGETLPSDSTQTIRWRAATQATKVKLFYSKNKGTTWEPILEDFVTGTTYDWHIPTQTVEKKAWLVKAVGYDSSNKKVGADRSDTPFTVSVP